MKETWGNFAAILSEILEIYQVLLDTAGDKRQILITGKTKGLEELTKKEELLVVRAGKLEVQRKALTTRLAVFYGKSEELSISDIRQLAKDEDIAGFDELAAQLEKVLKELAALNQINNELVKQALFYVNFNMNILMRNTADVVYPSGQTGPGTGAASSNRSFLDHKV